MTRAIGLPINAPKKECDDPTCPFHGKLSVRKKMIE